MVQLKPQNPYKIYPLREHGVLTGYMVRFNTLSGQPINRRVCCAAKTGVIETESPEILSYVHSKIALLAAALGDDGQLSARGRRMFKSCMSEYIEVGRQHRRNTGFESHANAVVAVFGDRRLSSITRDDVRAWIKDMEQKFANKTISNRVDAARCCVKWLITEGKWTGANPFVGHEWNGQGTGKEIKPTITREELDFIVSNSQSRQFQQAVTIGYYTGLRPTEVCNVQERDFNHDSLYMTVRVAKSKKRAATRRVAIPAVLSAWIINHGYEPMKYNSIGTGFERFVSRHPEFKGLCLETFRHNFSNMFRLSGVPADVIDVHQGRVTRVQDSEYNVKDPMFAVNLMRSHMDRVFGYELRAIK